MPLIPKTSRRGSERILYYVLHTLMIMWILLLLFPIFWMLSSSMKSDLEVFQLPPKLVPSLARIYTVKVDYTDVARSLPMSNWQKDLEEIMIGDAAMSIWGPVDEFRDQAIGEIRFEGYLGGKRVFYAAVPGYVAKRIRDTEIIAVRLTPERILRAAPQIIPEAGYKISLPSTLPLGGELAEGQREKSADKIWDLLASYPMRGKMKAIIPARSVFRLFDTYVAAWKYGFGQYPFGRYILNSAIITGGVIVSQLTISSLAGYALSRLLPASWASALLMFFLATLMIPPLVLFLPLFLIMKEFPFSQFLGIPFPHANLTNTYLGVILPHTAWGFAIYLFKGFFDQIPKDLLEAARIDGASEWTVFSRIVIPLSKSVYGALALFTFLAVWNDFLWPFLVNTERSMWTFTVALFQAQVQLSYPNQSMASSFIASVPTLLMFILLQRSIERGVVLTGLKS